MFVTSELNQDGKKSLLAYLLGRSYVGMRVEDIATRTRFLKDFQATTEQSNELHLVGIGEAAIPCLHAAALDPDAFRAVTLRNMLRTLEELAGPPKAATKPSMSNTVSWNMTISPFWSRCRSHPK